MISNKNPITILGISVFLEGPGVKSFVVEQKVLAFLKLFTLVG